MKQMPFQMMFSHILENKENGNESDSKSFEPQHESK